MTVSLAILYKVSFEAYVQLFFGEMMVDDNEMKRELTIIS